jgi:hypothetical protein
MSYDTHSFTKHYTENKILSNTNFKNNHGDSDTPKGQAISACGCFVGSLTFICHSIVTF